MASYLQDCVGRRRFGNFAVPDDCYCATNGADTCDACLDALIAAVAAAGTLCDCDDVELPHVMGCPDCHYSEESDAARADEYKTRQERS